MAGYLDSLFVKQGDGDALQTAFICFKLVIRRIQKNIPLQRARLVQSCVINSGGVGRQFEKIGITVVHIQGGDPVRTRSVCRDCDRSDIGIVKDHTDPVLSSGNIIKAVVAVIVRRAFLYPLVVSVHQQDAETGKRKR